MARRPQPPELGLPGNGAGENAVARPMRLVHPHGFYHADGVHRFWAAGQVVQDGAELELLRRRGVDLQET